MNGEVKSYQLNDPMKWKEFKQLPDDLKKQYIQGLRKRFDIGNKQLEEMFGCSRNTVAQEIKRLGLGIGKTSRHKFFSPVPWERWLHGLPAEMPFEQNTEDVETDEMQELFDFITSKTPMLEPIAEAVETSPVAAPVIKPQIVPSFGMCTFHGAANEALRIVSEMLQDADFEITVTWKRAVDNG